jgi:hypothetical protein
MLPTEKIKSAFHKGPTVSRASPSHCSAELESPASCHAVDGQRVDLSRAVDGIVSAGRNLISAKADVRHGEWLPMLKQIGIGESAARKLMAIGQNEAITNRSNLNDLPAAAAVMVRRLWKAALPRRVPPPRRRN